METIKCPTCGSQDAYPMENLMVCPICAHEWDASLQEELPSDEFIVKDSNGNRLANGDNVIIIKNLPVKGAALPIRAGTKVRNIRLVDSDHNIDCKIDGYGAMALKSEFVRKA